MAMITTMLRKVLIACFLPSEKSIEAISFIKPSQVAIAKKIRATDRERLKKLYDALILIDTNEKQ